MLKDLKGKFQEIFGKEEKMRTFFAPGRVNLIGEHTDYNGGNVFPCALSFGTYAVARKRKDGLMRMYSLNFPESGIIEGDIEDINYRNEQGWGNYPMGVVDVFKKSGYEMENGFEVLFYGDIPNGGGLSSSASIELATSVLLNEFFEIDLDMIEMVKLSQKAENEFIGVNCGILDQFAIGMGRKNSAILLDCNTLKYEYAPVELQGVSIVIANTNKRRELADSKYNERREECERALSELKSEIVIGSLGELTIEEFEENKYFITNPVDRRRAKHAVYENQRAIKAAKSLKGNKLEIFGKLMNESHISLRDDYEVTGLELDSLVEAAWEEDGVIGARMTGAGFGGCTVNLVRDENIDSFIKNVGDRYRGMTGLDAEFYIASIGDGAREL